MCVCVCVHPSAPQLAEYLQDQSCLAFYITLIKDYIILWELFVVPPSLMLRGYRSHYPSDLVVSVLGKQSRLQDFLKKAYDSLVFANLDAPMSLLSGDSESHLRFCRSLGNRHKFFNFGFQQGRSALNPV